MKILCWTLTHFLCSDLPWDLLNKTTYQNLCERHLLENPPSGPKFFHCFLICLSILSPLRFFDWWNPAKDPFCSFKNESRVISINCGPMPQQLRLWISSRPFMDPLNWKDRCRQLIRKPIFFRLLQQSNTTTTTAVQVGVKDVRTRLNSRAATSDGSGPNFIGLGLAQQ